MNIFSGRRIAKGIEKTVDNRQTHALSWLSTDKAPLYVSFFFAALAWTLVRTVDRIAATPIVEYRVHPHSETFIGDGPDRVIGVRFRNMTLARPVNCLIVNLSAQTKKSADEMPLEFTKMTPSTYRLNGHVLAKATAEVLDARSAQLNMKNFPPGADIEFGVRANGTGKLNVKASPCEDSKGTEGAAAMPVILERSLKTRVIERELQVLWSGLGLWALALIGLAIARTGRAKTGDR